MYNNSQQYQPGQGQQQTGSSYQPSASAMQPQAYVPGGGSQSPSAATGSPYAAVTGNTYPSAPAPATSNKAPGIPAGLSAYIPASLQAKIPAAISAYQSATSSSSSSSAYQQQQQQQPAYQPAVVAPSAYQPATTANYATPSFSQALHVPPPNIPAYGSSSSTGGGGAPGYYNSSSSSVQQPQATDKPYSQQGTSYYSSGKVNDYSSNAYITATATPVGCAPSVAHSAVYKGGPTNGIVSEGHPTRCHKVDYEIKGHELQLVEIELDPNETVIAEAGALLFMDEGINFETKFGDGSNPKPGFFNQLLAAGGRLLTGESLFITHFTNKAPGNKARVAFAAPFPGNIVPINLETTGGKLICEKDAFLCAAFGTKVALHFNRKLGTGFFGGEGFIMQRLEGDGMVFIHAGGTVIRRELRNERLRLDTGCLVAMTDGINFDIKMVPGLKSIFFGGEGLFLATLEGTGTVWIQSLPLSRFADRIVRAAPSIGGRRQGETDYVSSATSALLR